MSITLWVCKRLWMFFTKWKNEYGDEFRDYQQALGQMSDIKHGHRKITAES